MKVMNYTGQAVKGLRNIQPSEYFPVEALQAIVRGLIKAQRFILPEGGEILNDKEYKALDGDDIRLPFETIAVEFDAKYTDGSDIYSNATKTVVLAQEVVREGIDCIEITPVFWIPRINKWTALPPVQMPRKMALSDSAKSPTGWRGFSLFNRNRGVIPDGDYANECRALLELLNALACSNVKMEEKSNFRAKSASASRKRISSDIYRVLCIDSGGIGDCGKDRGGSHASPRQHLRRGHIRRLKDKCIWVNACVVGSVKNGTVVKDYAVI